MTSPFFGEFMGTAVLILLGNGVVANVLLKKSKGEGGGWMVIASGWAFAVLMGVLTAVACGSRIRGGLLWRPNGLLSEQGALPGSRLAGPTQLQSA